MQSSVRFNRVPKKVPGGFGAEPGQVQQDSEQGSGEGLGGFGAEPGQVQQGSGEGSGEGLKALVRFQTRIREALVQSQVKFSVVSVRFGFGSSLHGRFATKTARTKCNGVGKSKEFVVLQTCVPRVGLIWSPFGGCLAILNVF